MKRLIVVFLMLFVIFNLSADYIKARHLDGDVWNAMYYTDKQQFIVGMHAITDGLAWHGEQLGLPDRTNDGSKKLPHGGGLGYLMNELMDQFDEFYSHKENKDLEIFKVYFYFAGVITEDQLRADTEYKVD